VTAPGLRVVAYVRVSGGPGQGDGERQTHEIADAAARNGWTVVETVREIASGADDGRAGLARVLEVARSGAVDAVAVSEVSRLSRSGIGGVFDIVRALDSAHVRILSLAEPWIDSPMRDPVLALVAWGAAEERRLLVERTRSGLARAKVIGTRSGRPVGRPRRLTPEVIQRIREERAKGLAWSVVAQHVGIPAGTCRKVGPSPQSDNPHAGNPPAEFRTPGGDR
jgi:putative DNA-invertase from lambdoid prophage Rac